jgi:thiamine-monophosphate kinase
MKDSWSDDQPTVGAVGESALIDFALSLTSNDQKFIVGNGDDAAVMKAFATNLTTTVDAQIEGVHFRRNWLSPEECGRRAFIVSASDLMAMGVQPDWALLSLGLPSDLSFGSYQELMKGFSEGCKESGATLVGGNITRSDVLSLHITVFANPQEDRQVWTRTGAQPGDYLWISGPCGDASAGLALLENGIRQDTKLQSLINVWKSPQTHWRLLDRLYAEINVNACMDLSDGLLMDAGRMARASNLRLTIDASLLPNSSVLSLAAKQLETDAYEWLLGGGESYQLLIAAPEEPPQWAVDYGFHPVGRVESGEAELRVTEDDRVIDVSHFSKGWDPF